MVASQDLLFLYTAHTISSRLKRQRPPLPWLTNVLQRFRAALTDALAIRPALTDALAVRAALTALSGPSTISQGAFFLSAPVAMSAARGLRVQPLHRAAVRAHARAVPTQATCIALPSAAGGPAIVAISTGTPATCDHNWQTGKPIIAASSL